MASTGRAQVNTWLPDQYVEFPFIDVARQVDRYWDCIGATSDFVELIASNNYPTAMPTGVTSGYKLSLVTYFIVHDGTPTEDRWVVTYDGGPVTLSLSVSTSDVVTTRKVGTSTSNRQEFTLVSASRPMGSTVRITPTITAMSAPFSNLRIFRKSHEALLTAGKKFNPEWTALYRGLGRLRFMDWLHINLNPIVKWGHRALESMPFWEGHNLVTSTYCGYCTNSQCTSSTSIDQATFVIGNQYTFTLSSHSTYPVGRDVYFYSKSAPNKNFEGTVVSDDGTTLVLKVVARDNQSGGLKTDWQVSDSNTLAAPHGPNGNLTKSTWAHGDLVTARLPTWSNYRTIASVTIGSDTIFHMPAHGYINGDKLVGIFAGISSLDNVVDLFDLTDGKVFTCSVIDVDTFKFAEGLNSTGISTPSANSCLINKAVMFTAGSLPPKPLLNYGLSSIGHIDVQTFPDIIWNLIYDSQYDGLKATMLGGSATVGSPTPWRFGMPWETLIDCANELDVDPYFCIPTCADLDYVTNLATLVASRLNTDLVASFEYSNEVWNIGILIPTGYCANKGKGLAGAIGATAMSNFYGLQFYTFMTEIKRVFAGQTNRINCVMAQQIASFTPAGNAPRYQSPLAGIPGGAYPISVADSIAVAPYLESDRRSTSAVAMVYANKISRGDPTAMQWMDTKARTNNGNIRSNFTLNYCLNTMFPAFKVLANAPAPGVGPKRLTMYEGGFGWTPNYYNITDKVQSITWSGGVATVTTVNPHNKTGTFAGFIQNAPENDGPGYNSGATIEPYPSLNMTVTGPNTFTYVLTTNPGYVSNIGDWGPCTTYNGIHLLTNGFTIDTTVNGNVAVTTGAVYNGHTAFRLQVSAGNLATLIDGQFYWIANMYGASAANGLWQIKVIDTKHFDLVGSDYVAGFIGGNNSGLILSDRDNFYNDYYRSTFFGQFLHEYLQGFINAGGEYPSQYTMIGAWGPGVMWGTIVPSMYAGGSYGDVTPAYTQLRAFNDNFVTYVGGRYGVVGASAGLTKLPNNQNTSLSCLTGNLALIGNGAFVHKDATFIGTPVVHFRRRH